MIGNRSGQLSCEFGDNIGLSQDFPIIIGLKIPSVESKDIDLFTFQGEDGDGTFIEHATIRVNSIKQLVLLWLATRLS